MTGTNTSGHSTVAQRQKLARQVGAVRWAFTTRELAASCADRMNPAPRLRQALARHPARTHGHIQSVTLAGPTSRPSRQRVDLLAWLFVGSRLRSHSVAQSRTPYECPKTIPYYQHLLQLCRTVTISERKKAVRSRAGQARVFGRLPYVSIGVRFHTWKAV
jgi:hypothetical protein